MRVQSSRTMPNALRTDLGGRAAAGGTVILLVIVAIGVAAALWSWMSSAWSIDDHVHVLDVAQRTCKSVTADVRLPDYMEAEPGDGRPVVCRYRLSVAAGLQGQGFFIPGLVANARVQVNGHVIVDGLRDMTLPLPRSVDRIVLIEVPDNLWKPTQNVLEISAAGPRLLRLSRVYLGPMPTVTRLHRARVAGVVVGPALVAAVVGTLGLCMLLLWRRSRDPLYGYFASGTLFWATHTAWTVLPWSPLSGAHHTVWWTSLYTFFVVMLIIFCIRFADWRNRQLEMSLWSVALATPLVLYGAMIAGVLDEAQTASRLLLVCLVGVGAVAVVRACLKRPDMNRVLIVTSGLAAFVFGAHDWLKNQVDGGDNPVNLVPYAGLVFSVFVVRMLIDKFSHAQEQLALMNAELGKRVDSQNTELRDAMERMRQARDAAEEANLAKTRFLAAASHDLRQPAHALALYMAALRSEKLEPNQADLVQRMSGSLSALETMFNMLLDMSRIDAGALTPALRTFSIEPLLRQLAEEFAPQAEARGLRLALRLPTVSAAFVRSDPVLVGRIVRNLLANAIKYTSDGGILLACRLRSGDQTGAGGAEQRASQWRIEVWDTGCGIAEHDRQHVFEEFFQVDNPGRDRIKGLGLGLSIVQRLIKLLDLKLQLHSRLGRGSCFAVCLPQVTSVSTASALVPVASTAAIQGMTVGMIEDDVEVRDAMRELLQRWGCTVVEGANAAELLLNQHERGFCAPPDALLVDHRLAAGKSGPTEANILFERWDARVAMLVVSGESEFGDIRAAGFTCLAKPVPATLLRNWLASVRGSLSGTGVRAGVPPEPGILP